MAERRNVDQTVAYLEAGYEDFGRRLSGLEKGFSILQGEVHSGFAAITSKIDQLRAHSDAQPKFDLGKIIQGVRDAAILFSMIVGGIIWITTGQFSGTVEQQKAHNTAVVEKLKEQGEAIKGLREITQWLPSAPVPARRN
jgi:hypothetical protein